MVCQYCTTVRSLDLTRDADLLSEASSGAATQKEFPCLACNHLHDPLAIEATLVEQLMQQLASYQLSDLKCSRCQQVKSNNLALHCHCSGRFQTVDSRTDLLKKLRTISSVAEYYSFQALHEAVEWVTEHL